MYISKKMESGLGREEHDIITTAVVDLANLEPDARKEKSRQIWKVVQPAMCKDRKVCQ